MRCVRCGAVIALESERCPRCGALATVVANAPPFVPDPHGVPVLRFSPASAGPPVAPDPYVRPERAADDAHVHRTLARLRMVLPAPRRRRSRRRLYVGLTLLLAVLVLAGHGAGVLARSGDLILQLGPLPFGGAPQKLDPAPTAAPSCLVASVDAAAAQALTQVTLTTGLRAPESHDFRPVDSVTMFHVGHRAYITFLIAAATAGTAGVTFCTPAGQIPGALDVPTKSNGIYAQFSVVLDAAHASPGVVTLTWDGAVAASLPFTVVT
jgi:hypothetical protein